MVPQVIRYPLDPTGISTNNLVQGEPHELINRTIRVIAPTYGAFFTESLKVYDTATGQQLTSEQYDAVEMYELPTARYGKEICAVVRILDKGVSNNVTLTYQCLGGEFGYSVDALISQINALNLDDRPVAWPDIIAKPAEYPPSMHLHDIGDIYGFEYLTHAIDRLRNAIELGDAASHDAIYGYIDKIEALLKDANDTVNAALLAHESDYNNPHHVTAAQLNAYTSAQVDGLLAPILSRQSAHLSDYNNPHKTTAAQVGAYSKTEMDALLSNQGNSINAALQAHISDQGNPHQTTAAQVGAYSKTEMDAKLATLNSGLSDHIADHTNPHVVTAAQVGLGNVPNYAMATDAEFAAANAAKFVNPSQVQTLMSTHRASGDHDSRYVQKGAAVDTSIMVSNGVASVYVNGAWHQFWPPVWQ